MAKCAGRHNIQVDRRMPAVRYAVPRKPRQSTPRPRPRCATARCVVPCKPKPMSRQPHASRRVHAARGRPGGVRKDACAKNRGRAPNTRAGHPFTRTGTGSHGRVPYTATPSQAPRLTPPPHQAHPVCPNRDAQPPCRNDPQDQRDDEGEESKREGRNKHPDKRLLMCHRRKRPGLPEFGVSRAVSGLPCPPVPAGSFRPVVPAKLARRHHRPSCLRRREAHLVQTSGLGVESMRVFHYDADLQSSDGRPFPGCDTHRFYT